MFTEPSEPTTTSRSQSQITAKDKGKGIMQEHEKPVKLDKEVRLEREREEEASKVANIAEWDDVQAMMDADYELAAKLQAGEQGRYLLKKDDNDKEREDLKQCFEIVPDEEFVVHAIHLAVKPAPIVEFDREDLENLWKLVMTKHGYTRPEEAYERVLWGDLKVMFENMHIYMLVEKRYPLSPTTITDMLNRKLQADYWNETFYGRIVANKRILNCYYYCFKLQQLLGVTAAAQA
ncbi:hypothetical protein Tco_0626992 [Tanacetum coccineum]|uniref:Uncharacterized protein n=1 Tax=Tanacetum coccineum TaxID=301880 RepID=A0ABQ4WL87_9ASTR